MQQKRQKAFTLIELLVVIAIISLLVSILLPSLQRAKEMATLTRCQVHLRGMAQSTVIYASENDDYVPGEKGVIDSGHEDYQGPAHNAPTETGWLYQSGVLESLDMWICPADRRPEGEFTYSYTINGRTGAKPGQDAKEWPDMISGGWGIAPRKYSTFPNPSEFIYLGEENTGGEEGYLINDPRFTNKDITEGRHLQKKSGVSYLDGHAGTIPEKVNLFFDPDYWAVAPEEEID